jgi:adenylate kinase
LEDRWPLGSSSANYGHRARSESPGPGGRGLPERARHSRGQSLLLAGSDRSPAPGMRADAHRAGAHPRDLPRRLVMLARPGAGKSTQASPVADALRVTHLSVGKVLRQEVTVGSALGRAVAPALERGDLAPDELVVAAILPRLESGTAADGYVLDGFPRDLAQVEAFAQAIDPALQPQVALFLDVSPDECRGRLLARAGQEGRVEIRLRSSMNGCSPMSATARRSSSTIGEPECWSLSMARAPPR